jgi:hypothetical protein
MLTEPSFAEANPGANDDAGSVEFFEKTIRPILVGNCYNCHSANTNAKGDLRVDDRNGLLQGGNGGPAVVPSDPDASLLIKAVRHQADAPKMPPKKRLTDEEIDHLARWIKAGAVWPDAGPVITGGTAASRYEKLRKEHWAWQPLLDPALPSVQNETWPRSSVDRFVLAALEANRLTPTTDADRRILIRRVSFDLTGLPPSPEEVEAFVADTSEEAFVKVVDRLLASPAFGERWGRHWLDVARYGESTGSSRNIPFPHAWRYRDYVIDAFNADKPYDVFIREQIAGDLLPASSQAEKEEHAIATGFLAVGVKDVNQRFKVRFVMDNADEQIDTVSRSILGLTVSCARCHDHKFDPIPTAEYYALAGIFTSSDLCAGVRNKMGGGGLDYYDSKMLIKLGQEESTVPPEKIEEARKAYEQAKKEFEAIRGTPEGLALGPNGRPKQQPFRLKMVRLEGELLALTDPAANGRVALGVRDAKTIADTAIRIRGEAEKLGPVVPRGFLSVVPSAEAPRIDSAHSGRLELAAWLTSPQNPLTPRVMANRVWGHLFGRAIVSSVDNFGTTGDVPSNPQLLDHLASSLIRQNWSIKALVRQLVLSRTYQLSSEASASAVALDPSNKLYWRHSPRRLEAEELRDAMLAASGQLDRGRPQASPAKDLKVVELPNNGPLARKLGEQAADSRHRSLYLPLLRGLTPTSLEVFDFAEQGMVTGARDSTTVAPQALFLLNDPLVRRLSLNLADELLARTDLSDSARVDLAYRRTLSRPALPSEIDRAAGYVADFEQSSSTWLARQAERDNEPAKPAETRVATVAAAQTKAAVPINPDEIVLSDAPIRKEQIRPGSPRAAAWASFCQALFGSAEFRYSR